MHLSLGDLSPLCSKYTSRE